MNYYKELSSYLQQHDLEKANRVVMTELANLLVKKRSEFVYMLKNAGLEASEDMSDNELINLFLSHIHVNKKLNKLKINP